MLEETEETIGFCHIFIIGSISPWLECPTCGPTIKIEEKWSNNIVQKTPKPKSTILLQPHVVQKLWLVEKKPQGLKKVSFGKKPAVSFDCFSQNCMDASQRWNCTENLNKDQWRLVAANFMH